MSINLKTLITLSLFSLITFFTACSEDAVEEILDDIVAEVTGLSLDQESVELEVGETTQLVATLAPEGITGDISWSTSDAAIATVVDGTVTAVSKGNAIVAATHGAFSATCNITVNEEVVVEDPKDDTGNSDLEAPLNGTDYFVVQMDQTTFDLIANNVTADLRPDDDTKFLYIWDDTFTPGTVEGNNFFGLEEGWTSLVVGSIGWSGAGFFINNFYGEVDMTSIFNAPDDYYFHVAFKTTQENSSYTLLFNDGVSEGRIVVGSAAQEGIEPYTNFERNGEWQSVEIPMRALRDIGLFYEQPLSNVNVISVLAGGETGTTLDMDAAFFYKK